jgi:uncharacterized protein
MRTVSIAPPEESGHHDGLAFALFRPPEPRGGVVVLHGADSCKESHFPFARACRAAGFAALAFDLRGHGASAGGLGAGAVDDVVSVAGLLPPGPRALRGSSMGGYLALVAAEVGGFDAVIAICPAGAEHLLRGLRSDSFAFRADRPALDAFLEAHGAGAALAAFGGPVLLLHAEGDERIPVEHSRELAQGFGDPRSRLVTVPGGHHRSVQRDGELQGFALSWLGRALPPAEACR